MIESYNGILKEEFMQNQQNTDNHTKFSIPLGDCIKTEYSEEGEMIGFSLRPKIITDLQSSLQKD